LRGGTDDLVALIPNAPLFVGKDAVRALYAQQLAMGKWINLRHQYPGECVVGDVAVLHGVATGSLTIDRSPLACRSRVDVTPAIRRRPGTGPIMPAAAGVPRGIRADHVSPGARAVRPGVAARRSGEPPATRHLRTPITRRS
jgi:hypothetical protein